METSSQAHTNNTDFKSALQACASLVNMTLKDLLRRQLGIQPHLRQAMEYSLMAPGKRVRAALTLWACEVVCGEMNETARISAAAIEMIHTYSLIHDDLPAMDDDDVRRGRPTCHKAYDEATAILAGDGLLTLAFEVLATFVPDPSQAVRLVRTLAEAAGPSGMIAGQMDDMEGLQKNGTPHLLQQIHINKTARMFAASAAMGGISAGATDCQIEKLLTYGLELGLAFQIADDILDVDATSEELGKTAGKDAEQGKITYPAIVGLEQSKQMLSEVTAKALTALEPFGHKADRLRELAEQMLIRTH